MRRIIAILSIMLAMAGPTGPAIQAQDGGKTLSRPLILVHVMPWFESKGASGAWGWHWTMGRFDPDRSDPKGKRQIASHYYPLIGPYDSADRDVLEYHALLMRISGIDGVIADWYGNDDYNDYAGIHRRAVLLFDEMRRRGMKFAVCYEDRAVGAMVKGSKLTRAGAVEHAQGHLKFCQENWFKDPAYAKFQGVPALLVFGPDYLVADEWEAVLAGLSPRPAFFTLHERRPPALGCFAWPPMWAAKEGVLDQTGLSRYLDRFQGQKGVRIAAAFPGFHDIYQQAGVQPSHGRLDARDGETFRETLKRAMASGSPFVQVATWNDFGEGTCVEPAREYGYRYLETLQRSRREVDPTFPYRPDDLRLPLMVFGLRKQREALSPDQKALDQAVSMIHAGKPAEGSNRVQELRKSAAR